MTAAVGPQADDHIGLAYAAAAQCARGRCDSRELLGAAALGLLEACRRFDPARGFSFSTFAMPRIRGAILDSLRAEGVRPRSWRRRGVSENVFVSLDAPVTDADGDASTIGSTLRIEHGDGADAAVLRQDDEAMLARGIATLSPTQRRVLTLYYFDDLKLHEIGAVLGCTESNICQIKSAALKRLRALLTGP
jgi:RNA polymerase sigma factor for flagellar operon FliA